MGTLTGTLGLTILQSQFARKFRSSRIPDFPGLSAHRFSESNSLILKNLRQSQYLRNIPYTQPLCPASVSWPYESWETESYEEDSTWSRSGFLQPEGGLELLAMALGVLVSVSLAVCRNGATGVSLGFLSCAFLTATCIALRNQIANRCESLLAQFNAVQEALAIQLSSIRSNVLVWGTGNGATVTIRDGESASVPATQHSQRSQEENRREETNEMKSLEIEKTLLDISKSVAQLAMVVANLDNKISSMEKVASDNAAKIEILTLGYSKRNKFVEEDTTRVLEECSEESKPFMEQVGNTSTAYFTNTEPLQNGAYRNEDLIVNGSGAQLKWEEAVIKDENINQVKSQVFEGFQSSKTPLTSNRVDVILPSEYDSNVREDQVSLVESNFMAVPNGAESSRMSLSQPTLFKFSNTQVGDTSMELFFQDAGVRVPQEDVATTTEEPMQSKQNITAVEIPKTTRNGAETVVQPAVTKSRLSSSVRNRVEEDTVVRGKSAQGMETVYSKFDGQRQDTSDGKAMRIATSRSSEYVMESSENYRAVPITVSRPNIQRLKRIMNGTDPSAVYAVTLPKTKPKPAESLVVRASQSDAGWDDYEANDRSGVGRGTTRSQGEERSSSKTDYGQSRRRESPSDSVGADFGGNGSSSDTDKGGNGSKRRQASFRNSDLDYDSGGDSGAESPTSQDKRPPPAGPSYPSERTDSYQNLPGPNSPKPGDEAFRQIIDEVEALLKEGREGLEGRIEVDVADRMLYEAANLCAKAFEMRPSSLIAVGLWGNTLLLHGELKLRFSQNLRSMLPDPPSKSLNRREFREAEEERLELEATLQDVCEECEQLLVEAGRKYRLALSMDRTDMRALYNWGLALCYRGQLIAEEGGETAAQDADKVFLAAIDKFEAMMGLSDEYAAGALLNWGLAMRDRSRLRPLGSKDRRKIMAQAKEIFEEALRLDPNYGQARGAVAASTVELKRLQEYEEEPRESRKAPNSRGLLDWWS